MGHRRQRTHERRSRRLGTKVMMWRMHVEEESNNKNNKKIWLRSHHNTAQPKYHSDSAPTSNRMLFP